MLNAVQTCPGSWDNSGLLASDCIYCMLERDGMELLTLFIYILLRS